jgi:NitT/TauT family transport system substrate-binding protein
MAVLRGRLGRSVLAVALLSLAACTVPPAAPAVPAAPAEREASASASSAAPAGPGAPAAPMPTTERVRLRVPYVALSVTQLPAWVAQDAGLFAKQGLDVTLEYIAGSSTMINAMIAGEAQFSVAAAEAPIAASLAGADLVILAPTVERLVFSVYGRPDLAEPTAVRGGRVGMARAGSATDFAAREWLRSIGLRPDQDATLIQMGGQPETVTGLLAGAVDAGVIAPPNDVQARRQGLRLLADLRQLDVQFYPASLVTSRQLVVDQPDVVRRFLRATTEAVSLIHQDPALARQVLGRYTQIADEEVLEESYQAVLPVLPRTPLPTRAAVESALALLAPGTPAAVGADPERFYDPRFVQELEDSGFIRALYR